MFTNVSQEKDRLADENRHLKALLRQSGIAYGGVGESPAPPSIDYTSSASVSGHSYPQGSHSAFTPPLTSLSLASSLSPTLQVSLGAHSTPSPPSRSPSAQPPLNLQDQPADFGNALDYEQAGIDFVLRYADRLFLNEGIPDPHSAYCCTGT